VVIRRELARRGDRTLREVQFVSVSGQVCSLSYEVDGPEMLYFSSRQEAQAALMAGCVDAPVIIPPEPRV
jgi:hypothetical protein